MEESLGVILKETKRKGSEDMVSFWNLWVLREREVTMTDTLLDIEGYPISLYNILLYFFFLCCLTKLPILCLLIYSITATKLFNFHSFDKWVSKWNTCNKVDDNAKHSCYISCEIIWYIFIVIIDIWQHEYSENKHF